MSEPIMSIASNGDKKWKLNGKLHRDDGPAVEYSNGTKTWHINGVLHREDVQAREWWLKGRQYSKEQYTLMMFFGVNDE